MRNDPHLMREVELRDDLQKLRPRERRRLADALYTAAVSGREAGITDPHELEEYVRQVRGLPDVDDVGEFDPSAVAAGPYGSILVVIGMAVLTELIKWIVRRLLERWSD